MFFTGHDQVIVSNGSPARNRNPDDSCATGVDTYLNLKLKKYIAISQFYNFNIPVIFTIRIYE